ncbi:hypothetical protein EJ08DRAFT_689420 [Tothia fuscella]|uniref:Dienelactone hydrolase domain-containing protein n=1 Tax=Tothia fuscella TaxID=1048955 RepID=A0A9P4TVV3_9PEZI|nr:hypothetical protein EJ08DRAFT_689420 [Tothia fuscella]
MATFTPSPACCRTAPPEAPQYEQQGKFIEENGMKIYETGSEDASQAILLIYDVFGMFPQTIRGADILAAKTAEVSGKKTKVFMPDFFPEPADITQYPPDTPEKVEYINNFFNQHASPKTIIPKIPGLMKSMAEKTSTIQSWGIHGHCWGGKIAALVSAEGSAFKVATQTHPSLLDPADAEVVTIPMMILPSGDEDVELVAEYEKRLKTPKHVETFPDRVHGWTSSKADFEDPSANADYHRAYKMLSEFFAKYL